MNAVVQAVGIASHLRPSGGSEWPTVNAPYGGPVLARLTLGDLASGLGGFCLRAESAKRDEIPWSIYL